MSKTKSFIFKGSKSFSSSKLDQIKHKFNKINEIHSDIYSNEIYLVQAEISDINIDSIQDILSASELNEDYTFYVGPRLGTISPWSSKTEDIIKNVGIKNVTRVERLFGFKINPDIDHAKNDFSMFYDRMTQSLYKTKEDFKDLFVSDEPRSLNNIDILQDGKEALVNANNSYGFAMSTEEIDYLYSFYFSENRNPTDAELMMFAQANSEH